MAARSAVVLGACVLLACGGPPELPRLAQLPEFSLRDQDAAPFGSEQLAGEVWIASFMFTSCPDICPVLTTKLAGLRTRLRGDRSFVRYVSFSVDPETDTPPVLKRYAAERGADREDWRFLTGSLADIKQVVVSGFKQSMQPVPEKDGEPANILHGSHFVLIDGERVIRGYYRSDQEGLLTLARDARVLTAASERTGAGK
jgi:protein SCO1/2